MVEVQGTKTRTLVPSLKARRVARTRVTRRVASRVARRVFKIRNIWVSSDSREFIQSQRTILVFIQLIEDIFQLYWIWRQDCSKKIVTIIRLNFTETL